MIETERLLLRECSTDDFETLYEIVELHYKVLMAKCSQSSS